MRVPAEGDARETPVVFLHGGPGVPDLKGDSEYFDRLARDDFDVYVYDMVGRGGSRRRELLHGGGRGFESRRLHSGKPQFARET